MKKFIAFALIGITLALFQPAMAQTSFTGSAIMTNAGGGTLAAKVLPAAYGNLSLQFVVTKTSGTVAGTVYVEASNDGVNYVRPFGGNDSLNLADQAVNTKVLNVGISPYAYYRARVTTSGTMVAVLTGFYVFRQHP